MVPRLLIVLMLVLPGTAGAEERLVRLYAPEALRDTGLLDYILPRFKLKTRVAVDPVERAEAADMVLGETGRAVFEGAGQVWRMEVRSTGHDATERFAEWLLSEIGVNTVQSFAPEGTALFGPPQVKAAEVEEVSFEGDAALGHEVSRAKCTRCHAVDAATRGWGIGSTPSFGVLRAMPDWDLRFSAFYALNPHPAFTQIADVTEPFPEERPSPIAPIEMTLDELEAMLAYVAAMPAADLGKPLEHQ